ncbi:MAG TPA: type II CAAX endopeptidase family protein [Candidatus Synoicihabitans sp.]|nr:type II CAAX endopeptidase family protein [Candidatus Synoicihabitans sp.]
MITSAPPRPLALITFVVAAAFAWAIRWFSTGFFWIPAAPDLSHTISILLALTIVVGTTWIVLRRERLGFDSIGFTFRPRYVPAFGFGALIGTGVVVVVALLLTLTLRGHWQAGAATWGYVLLSLQAYFWGSMLEELMFRGYLLPRLIAWWGRGYALAALAVAFGLLHLPGLSGLAAVKMVGTTAACGFLYSALVLRTGTVWSAIAAHAAMNWVLHTVLGGTGKPGLFRPEFASASFHGIDIGFWALLLLAGGAAFLLLPKANQGERREFPEAAAT